MPRKEPGPPNRIRELRQRAGLTQQQLADLMSAARAPRVARQTVEKLEKSEIPLTDDWMHRLAAPLGVEASEIMSGRRATPATVKVVGYVGAGDTVYNYGDPGGGLGEVEAPLGGEDTVAVVVRGSSMYPRHYDNDHLYFRPNEGVPPHCLGRECIVHLSDGRTLVKELRRGSRDGVLTLLSHNAPPIEDVEVIWATRVLYARQS